MNNTYVSEKFNIVEALDEIEAFNTRMMVFVKKHPEYNHSVSISKKGDSWVIKLNVNNEQNN